jgi:hypothetical protein
MVKFYEKEEQYKAALALEEKLGKEAKALYEPEEVEKRYFITVDYLNKGRRGLFCNREGKSFSKETPHTFEEMLEYLGDFYILLSPKSEPFSKNDLKRFTKWIPLAEYRNQYGIAVEQ